MLSRALEGTVWRVLTCVHVCVLGDLEHMDLEAIVVSLFNRVQVLEPLAVQVFILRVF